MVPHHVTGTAHDRTAGPARPALLPVSQADIRSLRHELREMRRQVEASRPAGEPLRHMQRLSRLGWAATFAGYALSVRRVSPIGAAAMAFGRFTRWALVAHSVLHRSYDREARRTGAPRWDSRRFGRGLRGTLDWFDWFGPDGWRRQHNRGHHRFTGGDGDPDRLLVNIEPLARRSPALRALMLAGLAASWRWSYYVPAIARAERAAEGPRARRTVTRAATYGLVHFVLVPLVVARRSPRAAKRLLATSLLAEVLANVHTFLVVGPTHSGASIPVFEAEPAGPDEHLVHQIVGSADYLPRGPVADVLQAYMGYQIEHHIFPDLPPSDLPLIHDGMRRACERRGLPWAQRSWVAAVASMARMVVTGSPQPRCHVLVVQDPTHGQHRR